MRGCTAREYEVRISAQLVPYITIALLPASMADRHLQCYVTYEAGVLHALILAADPFRKENPCTQRDRGPALGLQTNSFLTSSHESLKIS